MDSTFSLDDIHHVAAAFWKNAGASKIFAFHGTMGAGKTTFIHALCDVKGVKDVVGSPTFSIINEYAWAPAPTPGEEQATGTEATKEVLYHMDLYRLKDKEEAIRAGVEDALHSGNICLVEWPENAPGIFPATTVDVYIELVDSKTRRLKIGNN